MAYFGFCLELVKREGKRFNVAINATTASQLTAATASDVNFDNANNRCAFLYRCGLINLTFARDCFNRFFSGKHILFLLSDWIKSPDLTVCSISNGPALDYIALLLSCQEQGINSSLFKNIKLISKYGAWRNTVNTMIEVVKEGHLSLPSLISVSAEVIQGDPFTKLTEKIKVPICNSDIVLMVKTLNLQADKYDPNKIAKGLQEFLVALKPGAILFCIDTKPSISLITHQLCTMFGSYLFEPTFMNTMINLDNADPYKDVFGCLPVVSARGSFLVWQKSSTISTPNFEALLDEVTEPVTLLTCNAQEQNDKLLKNIEQVPSTDYDLPVPHMKKDTKHMTQNSSDQDPLGNVIPILKYIRPFSSPLKSNLPISAEESMESNNEKATESVKLLICNIQASGQNDKLLKNNEQVPSTDFGETNTVLNVKKDLRCITPNSSDQELLSKVSNSTPSSKCRPAPNLSKSNSLSSSEENVDSNNESSNTSILVDQAVQTQSENAEETDTTKITELTSRIVKLTATISEMLETSEGDECEHSVLNDSIHNHHSVASLSCSHHQSCTHFSEFTGNCHGTCSCYQKRAFENCCQNHGCQHVNFNPNQCSSRASFSGDFEASSKGNSYDNSLKLSAENNSGTTPKLVIPLNSLSGNAIAQILSIISQSNQTK